MSSLYVCEMDLGLSRGNILGLGARHGGREEEITIPILTGRASRRDAPDRLPLIRSTATLPTRRPYYGIKGVREGKRGETTNGWMDGWMDGKASRAC